MAVAPTGNIFKALSFDNVSSRTYGVYITGEAVYNAPERDVEMVSIPGRNGSFALDHGRFENIEVTYPAGIFADNEADFAQAVSDFRNYLCSKQGYCRLSDEYNPDEYRMAVYKSGLEVDPAQLRAGEFNITFECKPQRWLTSGEDEVAVADSETLTNPTLFEASPIIKVEGYGTISTGGQSIEVEAVPVGNVFLANSKSETVTYLDDEPSGLADVASHVLDLSNMNTGDTFTLAPTTFTYRLIAGQGYAFTSASVYSQTGADANVVASVQNANAVYVITFNPIPFVKGTAKTVTFASVLEYAMAGGGASGSFGGDVQIAYDGANTVTLSAEPKDGGGLIYTSTGTAKLGEVSGYSTVLVSGEITIDLDIGEAYWENNGSVASANFAVSLGSELMKLKAGANTIAYSNTFTSCKIIPRWWKV